MVPPRGLEPRLLPNFIGQNSLCKSKNYYSPRELEREIAASVQYCNHQRYHESLNNLTSADVYFGREKEVLSRREQIKQRTLRKRRL
jgi:putative transposase